MSAIAVLLAASCALDQEESLLLGENLTYGLVGNGSAVNEPLAVKTRPSTVSRRSQGAMTTSVR